MITHGDFYVVMYLKHQQLFVFLFVHIFRKVCQLLIYDQEVRIELSLTTGVADKFISEMQY